MDSIEMKTEYVSLVILHVQLALDRRQETALDVAVIMFLTMGSAAMTSALSE
jgi:hypothetical protein